MIGVEDRIHHLAPVLIWGWVVCSRANGPGLSKVSSCQTYICYYLESCRLADMKITASFVPHGAAFEAGLLPSARLVPSVLRPL